MISIDNVYNIIDNNHNDNTGYDISTSPLALASEFFEKMAFGQVHFSFHLPEWASWFSLDSTYFYIENSAQIHRNMKTNYNATKSKSIWFSNY